MFWNKVNLQQVITNYKDNLDKEAAGVKRADMDARFAYIKECDVELAAFVSKKPVFKIQERPNLQFYIYELEVFPAYLMEKIYKGLRTAEYYANQSTAPIEKYRDMSSPFNTFEEAEQTLKRIAEPEKYTVNYNSPPLVRLK